MDESSYNPTEDEIRTKIKNYGYWKITLQPKDDKLKSIEECKDAFFNSQIRHSDRFFPLTNETPFIQNYCIENNCIKDYGYDTQNIIWWVLYTNSSFEMELRIRDIERNNTNIASSTLEKQLPPINENFEPKMILYQLIEIKQFIINLSIKLNKKYCMNVSLCNMKDKRLLPHLEDDKESRIRENNRLLIDNNRDPKDFKCKVDEIILENQIISEDNIGYTWVLEQIRDIYCKFNHRGIDRSDFDDAVKNQIKIYFNKFTNLRYKHNFIPKK